MDLSQTLADLLDNSTDYVQARDVVRRNSQGSIWLIGGTIIDTLLGNTPKDYDFLVEKMKMLDTKEWHMSYNSHGNPKFTKEHIVVDLVPFSDSNPKSRTIRSIDEYLRGTPLTIQSIAYNIITQQVVGDVGIAAFLTKTVAIYNEHEAKRWGDTYGTTPHILAQKKAQKLGFQYVTKK